MTSEEIVYQLLRRELDYPVFLDVPQNRPEEFITLEHVGGRFYGIVIDDCLFNVKCWSTSRYKASKLASLVDELLRNADIHEARIVASERLSLLNNPDLDTGTPRYELNFNITIQNGD